MIRDAAVFAFLLYDVINYKISISDYIWYFGLITSFGAWLRSSADQIASIKRASLECEKFRDFIDYSESLDLDTKPMTFEKINKIEFRNVDFSYGDTCVLKDINLIVNKEEKIAIVGENGAGKTTLIKLLCGFYSPSGGEILINDVNVSDIEEKSYLQLFSAVFQDHVFLPTSIKENICFDDIDDIKLEEVLQSTGLLSKINNLKDGINTKLIKQINFEAVELSGGEKQRLLMARALYKNAPILILDEPTAALDPIAEEQIYQQYDSLARDKISFFISHRLASTQFCDKIVFLKEGTISEIGTHDDLLKKQGDYWKMFEAQAYYYRKENGNEEI